jgi:hypothetical protein
MMAQERGTLILGLGDKLPITIAEPVVKMEYAMVGLIVLAICLTAIPHGIWWDSYGAYASSLFLIYIIAFQSAALSVGWINDQQINTIDLKNSMKNDEIEGSVKAWLQELKTLLDAWSEDAPSHHIRVQNEAEKLWQIKFLMKWAFNMELVMENVHHIGKLDGDWSSSENYINAFASNQDQDHTCLHDVDERLNRITTLLTNNGLAYDSGYINVLAWATHVNTFQPEQRLTSCRCRGKPLCIYTERTDGQKIHLSSVNFIQPQSPGKWKCVWLSLCSIVAITNILFCYPAIFAILNLSVKIYMLEFANVPNYGDVYGCLNCINNAAYFRNGTLKAEHESG